MKFLSCFYLVIVFLNVLTFGRSQGTTCIRGKDAKKLNDRLVQEHNKFRSIHGVPSLEGDTGLIEDSITWSEQMTSMGTLDHSHGNGYGENLYMNSLPPPIDDSKIDAVQQWYDEIKLYKSPQFTMETGHFTQVVWKSSRKVGCGICAGAAGTYLTCRYTPAGNFANEFEENVPPVMGSGVTGSAGPLDTFSTSRSDVYRKSTFDYSLDTRSFSSSDGSSTSAKSYTEYNDQTTDSDTRSTIKPNEQSDTYLKILKCILYTMLFMAILLSLVPVALISSMIYKSISSSHRPIN